MYSINRLVDDDEDFIEEHQSVHKARLSQQQPSNVSLEDCLKLFTKEEKVLTSFYYIIISMILKYNGILCH